MTWHTTTVAPSDLSQLLRRIRAHGGTVVGSRPGIDGIRVTWTNADLAVPATRRTHDVR